MKLITAILALSISLPASAETLCDEWANFSKIIAYHVRDDLHKTRKESEAELRAKMGTHPEIEVAVFWLNYAYNHPELNYVDLWKSVYKQCNSKATM